MLKNLLILVKTFHDLVIYSIMTVLRVLFSIMIIQDLGFFIAMFLLGWEKKMKSLLGQIYQGSAIFPEKRI